MMDQLKLSRNVSGRKNVSWEIGELTSFEKDSERKTNGGEIGLGVLEGTGKVWKREVDRMSQI
jgi:hypothetical protein